MLEDHLAARSRAPAADFSLAIINVVFLLLFFFILTGSVVQRPEMEVRPPFTRKLPLVRLPRPLITISDKNELFLDGVPLTLDQLFEKINRSARAKDSLFVELNILADGALPARKFLATVDALRATDLPIRVVTVRSIGSAGG